MKMTNKIKVIVFCLILFHIVNFRISAQQSFNVSNNKMYLTLSDGDQKYEYLSQRMTNYFANDKGSIICKVPVSSFVLVDSTQFNIFSIVQQDTSLDNLIMNIFFENNYLNIDQLKGNSLKVDTRTRLDNNEINESGTFSGMYQRNQIIYNLQVTVGDLKKDLSDYLESFIKLPNHHIKGLEIIITDAKIPFSK